ncbi:transporter, auxin efflux carrier (AEC) family [Peptoniphilus sp. ING2-D1G]|nr:transporter, auxin efflux carrier (AEC) family [Peptoniphilus sp. ING2-D1G]
MGLLDLFSLQGTLFAIMLVGTLLKKIGLIDKNGKRCLIDLCINVVIPCNIFRSFLIEFNWSILQSGALILVLSIIIQIICLNLNRFLFNGYPEERKKVMKYCTIVPNSFFGNPISEGIYGQIGVLYASIFLIPMRIVIYSVGVAYFISDSKMDKRMILKNVLTHPCLVSIYLGVFFMVTQIKLPTVISNTVYYIANCNTALSMLIVGTILADIKLSTVLNKDTMAFSVFRLILLPAVALGVALALGLRGVSLGVGVLMTAMPTGATAAMFAERYNSDFIFATRCIVMTTLASMLTLPIWSYLVG